MADSPLRCLFWRVADTLDYLLTLTRLRILDALAGPEPETPADQQREARSESGSKGRSLRSSREEPGAAISHRADRLRE